jgi:hypothetical protein
MTTEIQLVRLEDITLIPDGIQKVLLPDERLSVASFISFCLPVALTLSKSKIPPQPLLLCRAAGRSYVQQLGTEIFQTLVTLIPLPNLMNSPEFSRIQTRGFS